MSPLVCESVPPSSPAPPDVAPLSDAASISRLASLSEIVLDSTVVTSLQPAASSDPPVSSSDLSLPASPLLPSRLSRLALSLPLLPAARRDHSPNRHQSAAQRNHSRNQDQPARLVVVEFEALRAERADLLRMTPADRSSYVPKDKTKVIRLNINDLLCREINPVAEMGACPPLPPLLGCCLLPAA